MASAFKKFLKSERGNVILETAIFMGILFIFAIIVICAYRMFGEINTDIQADPDISADAKAELGSLYTRFPSLFDGLFLTILILLWILVIVASFMVDAHPIFFAVTLILLVFILIAAVYLGNSYEEIASDDDLSSVVTSFPILNYLSRNILIVVVVMGLSVALALFGKNRLAQ